MFGVLPATPPLAPFIACYWVLHGELEVPLRQPLLTDLHADLVFNFGFPYRRTPARGAGEAEQISDARLLGQRTYPALVTQSAGAFVIGVRFAPGGLAAFTSVPVQELKNLALSPCDVFGDEVADLEAQLHGAPALEQRLDLLNTFFRRCLNPSETRAGALGIAARIAASDESARLGTLSAELGLSSRTLRRTFERVYGVSPKFYARVTRLQRVLAQLEAHPDAVWGDLVYQSGYYDQAHLINDFRALVGEPPERYRRSLGG